MVADKEFDQISRVGDSFYTDLAVFLLKLGNMGQQRQILKPKVMAYLKRRVIGV